MDGIIEVERGAGRIIRLSDKSLINDAKTELVKERLIQFINAYHADNPLADGIPRQELLSKIRTNWHIDDDKLIQAVLSYMIEIGVIEDLGKSIALTGFKIEYSEEQLKLKERIAEMYKSAGIEIIKNEEVLQVAGDAKTGRAIQGDLCDEAVILKLNPSYYISSEAWKKAVDAAESFDGGFTLAEYRDKLDTSRKYAEELLLAMDRQGITIFDGSSREVVRR